MFIQIFIYRKFLKYDFGFIQWGKYITNSIIGYIRL